MSNNITLNIIDDSILVASGFEAEATIKFELWYTTDLGLDGILGTGDDQLQYFTWTVVDGGKSDLSSSIGGEIKISLEDLANRLQLPAGEIDLNRISSIQASELVVLLDPTKAGGVSNVVVEDSSGNLNTDGHDILFAVTYIDSQGTGRINPFLRLQESDGNSAVQKGFNTSGNRQFDTQRQTTRSIRLSEFPSITIDGKKYYEFRIDLNESNPTIDLTKLQVFLSNNSRLSNYTGGSLNGVAAVIDLNTTVSFNAGLNSGSGSGDVLVYLPESALGTDGSKYVYIYTEWANADGGFEEFSVGATATSGGGSGTPQPLGKLADLSLSFSEPIQMTETITFILTLRNEFRSDLGTTTATGIKVKNLLPQGLNVISSQTSAGSYQSSTGIWNVDSLAVGSQVQLTITATLKDINETDILDYITAFTSKAEIIAANQFDPDSTVNNNDPAEDDQDSILVLPKPITDLSVTVTNDLTAVIPGTNVTYTVVVTNNGGSNVENASLTETIPNSLTDLQYFQVVNGTAIEVNNLSTLNLAIAVGESLTYEVRGKVASSATNVLTYDIQISAPDEILDINSANNADFESDSLTPVADLSITTSRNTDEVLLGAEVIYTVTIKNDGPSDVDNAVLSQTPISESLINVEYYQNGNLLENITSLKDFVIDYLAAGETITFEVKGIVDPNATGTILTPVIVVNPPENTEDPNATNNSSEDPNDLGITIVSPTIDLSVEKYFDLTTVSAIDNNGDRQADQYMALPGDTIAYTLLITNSGSISATNVLITEDWSQRLPIGFEFDPDINNILDGTLLDDANNIMTILVGSIAAGETKEVTITARISEDFIKTYNFTGLLGTNNLDGTTNLDIPEYHNLLLSGQFFVPLVFTKAANDPGIDFHHLYIETETTVTATEMALETNLANNSLSSRVDVSTIALDGTLTNGASVSIRSIEMLDGSSTESTYFINPDPSLLNGQPVLNFNLVSQDPYSFGGYGLTAGGSVTFKIFDVTNAAGRDGIWGTADDTAGVVLKEFTVTDGSTNDTNTNTSEITTGWAIDKVLLDPSKVFKIVASSNNTRTYYETYYYDEELGEERLRLDDVDDLYQESVSFFDINGQTISSARTDLSAYAYSFLNISPIGTQSGSTADSASPTVNHSHFLLAGDTDNDGILDEFGASVFQFFWNKLDDPTYLANLAIWTGLTANGDLENQTPEQIAANLPAYADEQKVVDFLYDNFLNSKVYSFENFFDGTFTLINEDGDETTIEVTDGEITPGGNDPNQPPVPPTFSNLKLRVNDAGVFLPNNTSNSPNYIDLETALSSFNANPFQSITRLDVIFEDSNGDGKVATRLQNLSKSLNFQGNWYIGRFEVANSSLTQITINSKNGAANLDLSGVSLNFDTNLVKFVLNGMNAQDFIKGTAGSDKIYGNNGRDTLFGFDGDDLLVGSSGSDILVGGFGNDTLTGKASGSGDQFIFAGEFGNDVITTFDSKDKILLQDFNLESWQLDVNGDGLINQLDININIGGRSSTNPYLEMSGNSLIFDLEKLGGGTIFLRGVSEVKTNAVII